MFLEHNSNGLESKADSSALFLVGFQVADDGLVAHGGLSHLDIDFRVERQVYIHARAKLDEAQVLVDIAVLAFGGIGDNATGHGTCHLAHEHFLSIGRFDDDGGAFVFGASLGQPSLVEIAVVVLGHLDVAVHGKPVGMYVGDAHKDGHHQSAVVEIFVFLYFLHNDHLAVSSGHDRIFRIAVEESDGAAEEVDDNQRENRCDAAHDIERQEATILQQKEQQAIEYGVACQCEEKRISALAV